MIGTLWLEFIDGTNCTHQVVSWGTDEYFFSSSPIGSDTWVFG